MMTATRVCVAVVCLVASGVPAAAKQTAAARPVAATPRVPLATAGRTLPLQIQAGTNSKPSLPQAKAAPFKPLQLQVTPRKPGTGPATTPALPNYNPLKRRHVAMPGAADTEYAF